MQNATREHSAIILTFIKLSFVFKTFVLSIFEWPLKTGLLYSFQRVNSKGALCCSFVTESCFLVMWTILHVMYIFFSFSLKKDSKVYFYASFTAYFLGLLLTVFIMHFFKHAQVRDILTSFVPMEFPIKFDTVKSGWFIVYFQGLPLIISPKNIFLSLKVDFVLANSADPDLGVSSIQRVNASYNMGSIVRKSVWVCGQANSNHPAQLQSLARTVNFCLL